MRLEVELVEEDGGLGLDALVDFADEALSGYAHRRIDFEPTAAAEPLRAEFQVVQLHCCSERLHPGRTELKAGGVDLERRRLGQAGFLRAV